jgi:hypothetical protein
MIVQRQAKRLASFLDLVGHRQIRIRGCGVARRMVVDILCPVFLCATPSRSVALSTACRLKSDT